MWDAILPGLLGSLAAGAMTAVGAAPVRFGRRPSQRLNDALLGFAAGVMLAATFFSLLVPAIENAEGLYGARPLAAAIAVGGTALGAGTVALLNETLPHEHFLGGREGPEAEALRRIWLFVIAIAIRNAPEGLAVGVAFGGGNIANGVTLAVGIGLQNAPEGLAVAVALMSVGRAPRDAFAVAAATGPVEPVAGALGAAVVGLSAHVLPWGLAFAAGAMIYVISHEIIPETHRHGARRLATLGLTAGLCLMMFLDVALG